MCVVVAFGCQRAATNDTEPAKTQAAAMPMGTPEMRVGSAAFHLEIGGIYDRYGDHNTGIDHFSQAATLAQDPAQRVQAFSALGRAKEAAGDRDGAIRALEQALEHLPRPDAAGASAGPTLAMPFAGPGGDDVLLRLARLYGEKGEYQQARAFCERALSAAREPWQREQLYRFLVEVDRKAGTLEKEIAAQAKTLDEKVPDESALRFLAVALAGDGMQAPAVIGGPPGQPGAISKTLVRVYERLYELRPEDQQVRQTLQSLLQRTGRIEDAVKLAGGLAPLTPMECEGTLAAQPRSATLRRAAEAIRIRTLAGQREKTLAETAKVAALAKEEGVAAYLVAAQLYLEQGAAEHASQLFEQATREARSREDRRQVAFARERAIASTGQAAELKDIHDQWKKSDDACLRLAATWREQPQAMMAAAPPIPPTPSPR
jgi:tetratricopeptide (TPR) repeat protein